MGPDGGIGPGGGSVGVALKAYASRPVGNRPESQPLDTSLFSHLNSAVNYHVILTKDYNDEEKKFSLATPNEIVHAYKRVWKVAPKQSTIEKDIRKVLVSYAAVTASLGSIVPGLGDRNGRRQGAPRPRGGARVRKRALNDYAGDEHNLHDDAKPAARILLNKSKLKHEIIEEN